ncbi:hypothetical protein ACOCG7_03340 [Paraburkholderia sp. DD10]|jgi:hypothetical protein|uniref:hypothetical protein n=1 Tax=Paraburkholderia TaxID=1822464 RepID=UPI001FD41114|nr:hypothetical protein [Paraburkholderia terricola]
MAARQKASFMPFVEQARKTARTVCFAPDDSLLQSLPRAPIVRSIEQRVFPLPFTRRRTKAAQRRCTIMHVMCVKAVTCGKCGTTIATLEKRRGRRAPPAAEARHAHHDRHSLLGLDP